MRPSHLGEFQLIDRLKRFQGASPRVLKAIGDDAAVLALDKKRYQLFTTDMLIAGLHFSRGISLAAVGYKAMAVNVSDIAAMGGRPAFAVVSIGVPLKLPAAEIEKLYYGLKMCADAFGVGIVGGDTVRSDKLIINVALLGEVERDRLVLRSGANPGDRVFVTGPLGGSLKSGRHLWFVPRVKEARFLVEHFKPTAMIDASDGLAGDLGHILKESGAGAVIDEAKVPLNRGVTLAGALKDGEDFELVFTLPSLKAKKLIQYTKVNRSFRFFEIGEIVASPRKLFIRDVHGRKKEIEPKGFEHF